MNQMGAHQIFLLVLVLFLAGCKDNEKRWTIAVSPQRPWIAQELKAEHSGDLERLKPSLAEKIIYTDDLGILIFIDGDEDAVLNVMKVLKEEVYTSRSREVGLTYREGIPTIQTEKIREFAKVEELTPMALKEGYSRDDIQKLLAQYNAGTQLMTREDLGNLVIGKFHLKELSRLTFYNRTTWCE